MKRIVPNQVSYKWLDYTAAISFITLYGSAIVSVLILIIDIFKLEVENLTDCLNKGLAFLSIAYFLTEFCERCIFHKAESLRNLDFIDNSFNTKFAQKNSSGYYSNDEIEVGILKMGINNFENTFFTKNVSAKMFNKELKKFIIVILLILVCILTSTKFFIVASQLALPFAIIQQTVKLYIYHCRVEVIFYNYKELFSKANQDDIVPNIIKNVINYEKILSWAGIPLDSKIFNKLNDNLSNEWNIIKQNHNIN